MTTLYQAFNIAENASQKQIRDRYRQLARQYHPDVNPGKPEAEDFFKKVTEIYEVLGNAEKRAEYDESLRLQRQNQETKTAALKQTFNPRNPHGFWDEDTLKPGWGRFWELEGKFFTPNMITGFKRAGVALFCLIVIPMSVGFFVNRNKPKPPETEWQKLFREHGAENILITRTKAAKMGYDSLVIRVNGDTVPKVFIMPQEPY